LYGVNVVSVEKMEPTVLSQLSMLVSSTYNVILHGFWHKMEKCSGEIPNASYWKVYL